VGYYMGDYYRGDPGFFSVLGGIAKKALGFIPGVGPILSGAADALGGIVKRPVPLPPSAAAAGAAILTSKSSMVRKAGQFVLKHPVLSGAGAAGVIGAAGAGAGAALQAHLAKGGRGGHRRRMRVTNPKALRRAIRRTTGFAKLAMKTIHIVHPKKKARFGGFRARRKR